MAILSQLGFPVKVINFRWIHTKGVDLVVAIKLLERSDYFLFLG